MNSCTRQAGVHQRARVCGFPLCHRFTAVPGHLFWYMRTCKSDLLVWIKGSTPRWKWVYCEDVLPFGTIKEVGSTFFWIELKPLRWWVWVKKYLFQKLCQLFKCYIIRMQNPFHQVSYLAFVRAGKHQPMLASWRNIAELSTIYKYTPKRIM